MKVITSAKYLEPSFENDMVRLLRINSDSPEYVCRCKWVDRAQNRVYIFDSLTRERILTNGSKKRVTANNTR